MAYIIEWVPENEKKGYMIPGYKEVIPSDWVIDREKNIKFFKYWKSIEPPHAEYFAFVYKNQVNKIVLVSDFVDGKTVRWKAYQTLNMSGEMVEELREAVKVYKLSGSPIFSDESVKVEIAF